MVENDEKLDRLCSLYEKLDDKEKGKVIKLSEGLFNSQKIIEDEISVLTGKNINIEKKELKR